MRVENTRWLVTGAASGIGDQLARLLVQEGALVVSLDRAAPSAQVHDHVMVDLADQASIDAALRGMPGQWDAVCNVAGLDGEAAPATIFAVNFLAARHISETVVGDLRVGGAIVNVASTSAHAWPDHLATLRELLASPDFEAGRDWFAQHGSRWLAEPLSQEALVAYTKTRGPQLIPLGVRMNAVSPGPVDTPMLTDFRRTMGASYVDAAVQFAGRHISAGEIARVIAFLGSRDSAPINGHNLVADGGLLGRTPPTRSADSGSPGQAASRDGEAAVQTDRREGLSSARQNTGR